MNRITKLKRVKNEGDHFAERVNDISNVKLIMKQLVNSLIH